MSSPRPKQVAAQVSGRVSVTEAKLSRPAVQVPPGKQDCRATVSVPRPVDDSGASKGWSGDRGERAGADHGDGEGVSGDGEGDGDAEGDDDEGGDTEEGGDGDDSGSHLCARTANQLLP